MAAEPEALRIGVLHGPNLNLLGQREPEVYGSATLDAINGRLFSAGEEVGVEVDVFQANGEGELVDHIQQAAGRVDGFLVNAGGYTHTSVALLDALLAVGRPYVEVHLSNLSAREVFGGRSLLAAHAAGVVMGFGAESYLLGLMGLVRHLRDGPAAVRARPTTNEGGRGP